MGLVTTSRKLGRVLGSVLDEPDRKLLGQLAVVLVGGASVVLATAGILGLAIRIFEVAAG